MIIIFFHNSIEINRKWTDAVFHDTLTSFAILQSKDLILPTRAFIFHSLWSPLSENGSTSLYTHILSKRLLGSFGTKIHRAIPLLLQQPRNDNEINLLTV